MLDCGHCSKIEVSSIEFSECWTRKTSTVFHRYRVTIRVWILLQLTTNRAVRFFHDRMPDFQIK